MTHGKHLQFYMDCMERGRMPGDGLCYSTDIIDRNLLKLFEPRMEDNPVFYVMWEAETREEHRFSFIDICLSKKKKAVALGAKEITAREYAAMVQQKRDKLNDEL
jgi:hypothetical protein